MLLYRLMNMIGENEISTQFVIERDSNLDLKAEAENIALHYYSEEGAEDIIDEGDDIKSYEFDNGYRNVKVWVETLTELPKKDFDILSKYLYSKL